MSEKVIDVTVMIFPDGLTHWFESTDEEMEYRDKCVRIWKEKNPEKLDARLMMAVARIRMFESDFNKIRATAYFCEFKDAGMSEGL